MSDHYADKRFVVLDEVHNQLGSYNTEAEAVASAKASTDDENICYVAYIIGATKIAEAVFTKYVTEQDYK